MKELSSYLRQDPLAFLDKRWTESYYEAGIFVEENEVEILAIYDERVLKNAALICQLASEQSFTYDDAMEWVTMRRLELRVLISSGEKASSPTSNFEFSLLVVLARDAEDEGKSHTLCAKCTVKRGIFGKTDPKCRFIAIAKKDVSGGFQKDNIRMISCGVSQILDRATEGTVEFMNEVNKFKMLCAVCDKPLAKACSQCRSVFFCDGVCQKKGWLVHKKVCKQLAAEHEQRKADAP